MTTQTFPEFVDAHPYLDAYDEEGEKAKAKFKRLGMAYFKRLAKRMDLEDSKVSFNPGGIAGSGDFHFKGLFEEGKGFDLFFNLNFPGIVYRDTTGFTDYTGGPNRNIGFSTLHNEATLIGHLERLQS